MADLEVHVGTSLEEMGSRFVSAWKRSENGETVNERHLSFDSLEHVAKTLTPKRIEILRHLHKSPAATVKALAVAIGRDYKNVHADVQALLAAGALDKDDAGALCADFETIRVDMKVAL